MSIAHRTESYTTIFTCFLSSALFLLALLAGSGNNANAQQVLSNGTVVPVAAASDNLPPVGLNPADYEIINGQISEALLHRYLKRSVSMEVADKAPYGPYCGQHNTGEEWNCWLDFVRYTRPKYIQLAGLELDNVWKLNGWCDHVFYPLDPNVTGQFKKAVDDIHAIDPQIICEASMIEFMPEQFQPGLSEVKIPDWVKNELPELTELKNETIFDRKKMLFSHDKNKQVTDVFIDITRPMSLAWYYFLGRMYIDFGYESLKFCQINQTAKNEIIPKVPPAQHLSRTQYIFTKLRNYAKQKGRRGFALINSQTQGLYVGDPAEKRLLLDFHVGPVGVHATGWLSTSQSGYTAPGTSMPGGLLARGNGLSAGTDHESVIGIHSGELTLYNNSLGGINPLGWTTNRNPFLVEMDCFGGYLYNTNPPHHDPNGWIAWAPWSWDESTWLAQQSDEYRRQFLIYAYHRIKCLDDAGHLQFAANRPYRTGTGAEWHWYRAYNCADGFKDAAIIKNLWDGDDDSRPASHQYYNRWASTFATAFYFNTTETPRGKCLFGDFNGDGNPDILETADTGKGQQHGWNIYLMRNGRYDINTPDISDTNAKGDGIYYIGDLDGDGKDDFLRVNATGTNGARQEWSMYRYASGYKQASVNNLSDRKEHLYTGDFNGDGKDDLLAVSALPSAPAFRSKSFKVYTSQGNRFVSTEYRIGLSEDEHFYIGDFNGDGKDDFIVTASRSAPAWDGYKVYHATNSGFVQAAYGKWPSSGEQLVVNDWNRDGYDDFTVIAGGKDSSNWYGSKTYLSNDKGNHFIYAYDFNDLGLTPAYTGYDKTFFIPFRGRENFLIRYNSTAGAEDIQAHRVLHAISQYLIAQNNRKLPALY